MTDGARISLASWIVRLAAGALLAAALAWAGTQNEADKRQDERITRLEEQRKADVDRQERIERNTEWLVRDARRR